MSRELQIKADRIMKELKEALQPISEEIRKLKRFDLSDEFKTK